MTGPTSLINKAAAVDQAVADLAHTRSVTDQNANDSRFLRLPGEIRNRIYEYVFCDVAFSTHLEEDRELAAAAFEGDSPTAWASACEVDNNNNNNLSGYLRDHSLALLTVSRQTYHETKILPFKLCTFHITRAHTMQFLKGNLLSEQCSAITKLRLSLHQYQIGHVPKFLRLVAEEQTEVTDLLPGLKAVSIHYERHPFLYNCDPFGVDRAFALYEWLSKSEIKVDTRGFEIPGEPRDG